MSVFRVLPLALFMSCASAPVVEQDPEPRDMVCERECEQEHRRCSDKPYWQQCEADLGECLDGCI